MRAGRFVIKDNPPEQLLDAMSVVTDGEALLSPGITERVIKQFARIPASAAIAQRAHASANWGGGATAARAFTLDPASNTSPHYRLHRRNLVDARFGLPGTNS